MGAILVLAAVATGAAFVWNEVLRRRQSPGLERQSQANQSWFLGGSAALLLSIAMGLEPFKQPFLLRGVALGVSVALTGVGSINARRLAAEKQSQLLAAADEGGSLADRVEALEIRRSAEAGLPTRRRAFLAGTKVVSALPLSWLATITPSSSTAVLFGSMAAGMLLWAGLDLLRLVEGRRVRRQIDEEIQGLLTPPREPNG
jgi:hypothetical protein